MIILKYLTCLIFEIHFCKVFLLLDGQGILSKIIAEQSFEKIHI